MPPYLSQMFVWAIIFGPIVMLNKAKIEAALDKLINAVKELIVCKNK